MLQNLIKQFIKKKNIIYRNYPSCGRKPCECLVYLDLNNKNDKNTYLICYESWFNWKYK